MGIAIANDANENQFAGAASATNVEAAPQGFANAQASPETQTAFTNAVTYGLQGLGVGFVDTVGRSLRLFGDDDVSNAMKVIAPGGLGDFYARNKEPLRIGGDIAMMFIPGLLGMKALNAVRGLREAGSLGSFLKNSVAADAILGSSTTLGKAEQNISKLASEGKDGMGIIAGRTFANPALSTAKAGYYTQRVIETARQTAAFEFASYAANSGNDTFYPADYTLTDQLKWAGFGFAGAAGMDFAIGRFAVRNLIKAAQKSSDTYGNSELAEQISNVISRPGDRGVATTYFARVSNEAKSAIDGASNSTLKTNASQDMISFENILRKSISDMGNDTHPFLPKMKLDPKDARVGLALDALKKDDTTLLFATKLGDLPDDKTEFYSAIQKGVKEANDELYVQQATLPAKIKEPEKLALALHDATIKQQTIVNAGDELHLVLENTGDLSTYRTRAPNFLDQNTFADLKKSTFKTSEIIGNAEKAESIPHAKLEFNGLSLDDRFVIGGADPTTPTQWSALYAMGSKLISNFKPAKGQTFLLNEKVPTFQADAILALAKSDPAMQALVRFDGKVNNLKDAEFQVVDQKYQDFVKKMGTTERIGPNAPAFMQRGKLDPAEVIQSLNLPQSDNLQPHPLLQLFLQAKLQDAPTLADIFKKTGKLTPQTDHPLDLLQAAMRETAGVADNKITFATSGKLFQQQDIRPLFVASKSIPMLSRNDAMLHGMIENRQAQSLARLADIDPEVAPIVGQTVQTVGGLASVPVAKDIRSLYEGVVSGRGIVTAQDRIAEQLPALKALSLITQEHDRQLLTQIGDMFGKELSPFITQLRKRGNYNHLVDYNRIEQAYRHGWDIKSVEYDDMTARFVLDETSSLNKKLFKSHFPNEEFNPEETTYLPDMSVTARKQGYTPLRVSELSAQTAETISKLSIQSGVETNALRVALGRSAISLRDFHLPTPELANERAWFVKNSHGDVVATFAKGTESQNQRRAEDAAVKLKDLYKEDHIALGVQDVQREHLFDDNFQGLIDYSDQLAKSGAPITGGFAPTEIDNSSATLENTVKSLSRQFLNVGIRARAAIFEPQINFAKQASQALPSNIFKENNIFQRYLATMFSRSTQSPKGLLGIYSAIDSKMDAALTYLYSTAAEASAQSPQSALGAKALRAIVRVDSSEQQYKQYQKLSDWSPFNSTEEWLASTHPEIVTKPARAFAAELSKVSSTLALRFMDVGTAVMNLGGLMATAPAVMGAMRKLPKESEIEHQARTAMWGSSVSFLPGVKPMSGMKAMMNGIHAFYSGELNEPIAEAVKIGTFLPEYEQLARALSQPQLGDRTKFSKFVYAASYIADHSEILSRKLAWSMAYKFGKDVAKFDDEKNLQIFAANTMNDMIGNYSPRNKPGMFQGAIGMPLGAFQTYMFNYYRRMYGYIERKDYRSLATAYATQASVFGAQSVPGWNAFNSVMFSNYDGSDNLNTRLSRKLSPGVAELLLHGSLSNIPALFGRGDLDIAFYPRGSVDFSQIPANPTDYNRAPPIEFLTTVAQGIQKSFQNIVGAGGFSLQEQEEIAANFTNNRAAKAIMEFAAGVKTDRQGQVIDAATFDAVHVAAAMLGSVPEASKNIQDAYNAQQLVEKNQEALRDQLNTKTRALMRGGEFGVSSLQDLVQEYMRSGGNPAYFGQWLRNTVETSFIPKADRKLQELSTSGKWLEFMNLLAAMQQNTNTNTTGDKNGATK